MSLDELIAAIKDLSPDPVVQRLGNLLHEWKNDKSTVEDLGNHVERYIGNTWIESDSIHAEVYRLWSSFRENAILNIGGMTMNERLYWFGLFDRFDVAATHEAKEVVYAKVQASPYANF